MHSRFNSQLGRGGGRNGAGRSGPLTNGLHRQNDVEEEEEQNWKAVDGATLTVCPDVLRTGGTGEMTHILTANPTVTPSSGLPLSMRLMQQYVVRLLQESRLTHNQLSLQIQPYKDTMVRGMKKYRLRRLVSPFEFVLELILDDKQDVYSKWFAEMQTFYGNEQNRELVKISKLEEIHPNACYVCKDPHDNNWHRVRVHFVNYSKGTANLFFVDLYKMQEVQITELVKIMPKFVQYPAPLYRCYLYDIAPKVDEEDTATDSIANINTVWPTAACQYLEDIALKRKTIYRGLIFSRSDTCVTKGLPDVYQNAGMVLVEKTVPTKQPSCRTSRIECTVNAKMVHSGYAVAKGIFACCQHTTIRVDDLLKSLPERVTSTSIVSTESASAATPCVVPSNEDLLRLWGLRRKGSDLGKEEPDSTSPYDFPFVSHTYFNPNKSTLLPTEFASKMCQVMISFVKGPHFMILHHVSLVDSLHQMQNCIKRDIETGAVEPLSRDRLRAGTPVACHFLDNRNESKRVWCRAVVKGKVKDRNTDYKLLLVDYGCEVPVAFECIRSLPEYLLNIPSFAIRAHVDDPSCIPRENMWSLSVMQEFQERIFNWIKDEPLYFLHQPPTSSIIHLELYSQEISYDRTDQKWIANSWSAQNSSDMVLNRMKTMPMMSSLFVSYGVDLFYEVDVGKDTYFWHYGSISGDICKNGGASVEKPYRAGGRKEEERDWIDKRRLHEVLFEPKKDKDHTVTAPRNPPMDKKRPIKDSGSDKDTYKEQGKRTNLLMQAFVQNNIIPSLAITSVEDKLEEE